MSRYTSHPIATWAEVLGHAKRGMRLYYHAPLDSYSSAVVVVRIYKNGKLRLRVGDTSFTADSGHLSRFSTRTYAPPTDPSGNPSIVVESGVSYTHPADSIAAEDSDPSDDALEELFGRAFVRGGRKVNACPVCGSPMYDRCYCALR